jgi:hypothetical protein
MTRATLKTNFAIVGRAGRRRPRARRLDGPTIEARRDAGYRRLAAVMLSLDVATLTAELRSARLRNRTFDLAA